MPATNLILDIPPIKGESQQEADWKEMIELQSWDWSVDNGSDLHVGQNPSAGNGDVGDIHLTKLKDKSSEDLFMACVRGDCFKEATLYVLRTKGEDKYEAYMTLKLGAVLVRSLSYGVSPDDSRMTESVTLHFRGYDMTYKLDDGTDINMKWDIGAQKADYPPGFIPSGAKS